VTIADFRESVGFSAGVSYERRRIYELINNRIATLHAWAGQGIPKSTIERLTSELQLLLTALDEAP
jgi:hypothetical protein